MIIRCLADFNNDRSIFSTYERLVILHSARFVPLVHTIQLYSFVHTLPSIYKREKFLFLTESYPKSYDQEPTQFNPYLETSLSGMAFAIES